jgi:lipopolysaccharide transport system ATP-binding protein
LEEFNRYKEMGKTVILVTHDIGTVQRYCDRTMLLRNGKIVMIGNSEEVGNKYVYQNMSDEERRMIDEEKNKKDVVLNNSNIVASEVNKYKSQKIAEITKVEFLDKEGKEKNVFETGEILNIEIEYKFREKIKDPIFGIIIRDEARNNVFALNTMYKKIETGRINKGAKKVVFSIKNYFATGIYYISPAVANRNQSNIDWKDNFKSVRIINKEFNSQAIADFDTDIVIK